MSSNKIFGAIAGMLVGVLAIIGLGVAGLILVGLYAAHPALFSVGLVILAYGTVQGWRSTDA